ncbi:MAG: acyltransferase family protein [Acidimicrobiales bacterium]
MTASADQVRSAASADAGDESASADAGDESGTAPGDRRFRPDIEGLRAVAVLLVVFYHAGFSGLRGGYVGVDVFFVISGFVITGVLLRERQSSSRTSLLRFYARRCRRIIPAATLVIVVTVIATYAALGVVTGDQTAIDARWTAVFLANIHFASVGTNYLTAQQPPSPLLNFWSLAVEEQFYLVYPALFLLIAGVRTRWTLQARLAVGLVAVIAASFTISVLQTASSPTVAYFSPFTRAWELALGALVAVGTTWLRKVPAPAGSVMTWVGLAAISFGAIAFDSHTAYPGSLVAIPVGGACLVIAGGVNTPRWAAERLLGLAPFRWFGRLSYSLYLWHWPILIIAAEAAGRSSLPFAKNIVWLAVALAASVISFRLVENPIRHAPFGRAQWASLALGAGLVAVSLGVATIQLNVHSSPVSATGSTINGGHVDRATIATPASSDAVVRRLVGQAPEITTLPAHLSPPLDYVPEDWGGPDVPCWTSAGQTSAPSCTFGDRHGTKTVVLYGDSHAGMWFDAMNLIADLAHWKLVYLGKGDCPANMLPYGNPTGFGRPGGEYTQCDQWHRYALGRMRQLHPDLVVVTQEFRTRPDGTPYTPDQWQQSMARTLGQIPVPPSSIVVIGNIPELPQSPPQCLSRNTTDVQACSAPLSSRVANYNAAERSAAAYVGARYVDIIPWFCSTTCTSVIGHYEVYLDDYHITQAYSIYLAHVLSDALQLTPVR